jgi:hypothetical protein
MKGSREVATVSVFSALIVGSNFALVGFADVKLDAVIVFLTTFVFGVRVGASVAITSEFIWSQISPWGSAVGYLLPFLLTAELFYVLAGWATRRALQGRINPSNAGILFAGVLCLTTFCWDFWTNLASPIFASNLSLYSVLAFEFFPLNLEFSVVHEVSNLLLGFSIVPAVLFFQQGRMRKEVAA